MTKARKILAAEVFNTEACSHFKWVIERYIDLGDSKRATLTLDRFFETFFPEAEESIKVEVTPAQEDEGVTEEEVKLFEGGKDFYTARELCLGLVSQAEYMDETQRNSAVRSLGIQLGKSFPLDAYQGLVTTDERGARLYSKDMESELINVVAAWEERFLGNQISA